MVQLDIFTEQWAPRIIGTMSAKDDRIVTPMPRKLVERIDDFRFSHRLPSRAEAIRQLVEAGLNAKDPKPKS